MQKKYNHIAVVVLCRNEKLHIKQCIDKIYNCTIPENCEIVVKIVDGMSDDGTRQIIESLQNQYPSLELIDNRKQLTPYAFNLGIRASQNADYIQIVGARHMLSINYLNECYKKLNSDNEIWCVGGKIVNEYLNKSGRTIASAMSTTFGMGIGNFRTLEKSGFTDTVTSPMYPKFVFEKIGLFDENLVRNQDDDFSFRVIKAGGKVYFDHEITLKYYVRGSFKGLWKQFFQYGYWKVYVNRKHKTVTTGRQLVPPLFALYLFVLPLTLIFSIHLLGFSAIPLFLYILLAIYFSIKTSKADNEVKFLEVLKTFPILHLSYGLGYLKGIWSFLILNQKPSEKQKELSR